MSISPPIGGGREGTTPRSTGIWTIDTPHLALFVLDNSRKKRNDNIYNKKANRAIQFTLFPFNNSPVERNGKHYGLGGK